MGAAHFRHSGTVSRTRNPSDFDLAEASLRLRRIERITEVSYAHQEGVWLVWG